MMRIVLVAAALMAAGCIEIVSSDGGPWPPEEGHTAAPVRDPALPGLVLTAEMASVPGSHKITAQVHNEGPRTYRIETYCGSPWSDVLEGADGRTFSGDEPRMVCLAFSLKDFKPGDKATYEAMWNETRWDHETDRIEDVEPGTTTWTVMFKVWDADDETHAGTLRVAFQVEVA